ncbi:MAG: hypothetical protein A2Z16_10080 [Chloroflexi bacterium RBG_16_54_18]|nr:MAG: hypothetical protein A2Z16_10080 [Chloroflexi bacterium RBG_16_54_18]
MILRILRRLPFTILMLTLLWLTALLTKTHSAQLTGDWMDLLGFAPADLLALDVWRLFTSAVTTNGGIVFCQAFVFTAFAVGWAEWQRGTLATGLVFWGVHLLTLIILSLIIALPLHWIGFTTGTLIVLSRDVGPSAGYFGVLGLDAAGLKSPWRWITGGLFLSGFAAALLMLSGKTPSGIALSASLAHLIAFPLGWMSNRFVKKLA